MKSGEQPRKPFFSTGSDVVRTVLPTVAALMALVSAAATGSGWQHVVALAVFVLLGAFGLAWLVNRKSGRVFQRWGGLDLRHLDAIVRWVPFLCMPLVRVVLRAMTVWWSRLFAVVVVGFLLSLLPTVWSHNWGTLVGAPKPAGAVSPDRATGLSIRHPLVMISFRGGVMALTVGFAVGLWNVRVPRHRDLIAKDIRDALDESTAVAFKRLTANESAEVREKAREEVAQRLWREAISKDNPPLHVLAVHASDLLDGSDAGESGQGEAFARSLDAFLSRASSWQSKPDEPRSTIVMLDPTSRRFRWWANCFSAGFCEHYARDFVRFMTWYETEYRRHEDRRVRVGVSLKTKSLKYRLLITDARAIVQRYGAGHPTRDQPPLHIPRVILHADCLNTPCEMPHVGEDKASSPRARCPRSTGAHVPLGILVNSEPLSLYGQLVQKFRDQAGDSSPQYGPLSSWNAGKLRLLARAVHAEFEENDSNNKLLLAICDRLDVTWPSKAPAGSTPLA